MSDNTIIEVLTKAVKAYGSAYCAMPNISLTVTTSATDLNIGGDPWEASLTLSDSTGSTEVEPYVRSWTVGEKDYESALLALCALIYRDLKTQTKEVYKQLRALTDARDIFQLVITEEESPNKVVELEAALRPNR